MAKLKRLPKDMERIGQYSTYRAAAAHARQLNRETGARYWVVRGTVPRWNSGMTDYIKYECYTVSRDGDGNVPM